MPLSEWQFSYPLLSCTARCQRHLCQSHLALAPCSLGFLVQSLVFFCPQVLSLCQLFHTIPHHHFHPVVWHDSCFNAFASEIWIPPPPTPPHPPPPPKPPPPPPPPPPHPTHPTHTHFLFWEASPIILDPVCKIWFLAASFCLNFFQNCSLNYLFMHILHIHPFTVVILPDMVPYVSHFSWLALKQHNLCSFIVTKHQTFLFHYILFNTQVISFINCKRIIRIPIAQSTFEAQENV